MGLQCEKTATTRQEKVSLQSRNHVVSGLTIDKGWNEKTLDNKVKAQFPEECKGTEFELVNKNVSGVVVKPIFASGVMHLSMLSRWGGRPGIGGAFELC